jgi:hypothetical protein
MLKRTLFTRTLLGRVEPFDATSVPSSTGVSGSGPQPASSNAGLNRPFNRHFRQSLASESQLQYTQTGLSEDATTHVSNTMAQPRTGKAAFIAHQQHQSVQQPVQLEDSGVRFDEHEGEIAGASRLPNIVPPIYTER